IDARRKLQRLCLGGGCAITVGDGKISHGLVDSLSEAVALLPSAGGRICLLPGEHEVTNVVLNGRQDVEIVGAGESCVLTHPLVDDVALDPDFTNAGAPLVTLEDC